MTHYEYIFEGISAELSDLLVAELSEIGFEGFEEQDSTLKAFVKTNEFQQELFDVLMENYNVTFSKSIISEKNWNEEWEKDFEPIVVKSLNEEAVFCIVRASFHKPIPEAIFDIIITPKMSFGTGHHATTLQMMQGMSVINFQNKRVIDFGTGTGLLAILAEKMGAKEILAIDNDDWSINNAEENLIANGCIKVNVVKSDFCDASPAYADVILANINLNVIKANLKDIVKSCKPNATVLFSGILTDDETDIVGALKEAAFQVDNTQSHKGWMFLTTRAPH
jgi:ribosomal protein L11 methyltransferase